jgi:hypothetical protein
MRMREGSVEVIRDANYASSGWQTLFLATDDELVNSGLDEEAEGEEEKAENEEAGAPEELKAMKLEDGVKKTHRDHHKTRFAAAFVKRSGGNIAGEAATECGEAIIDPECELRAMAPK